MGSVAHCGDHTPPYPGSLSHPPARQGRCASPAAISACGLTRDPLTLRRPDDTGTRNPTRRGRYGATANGTARAATAEQ